MKLFCYWAFLILVVLVIYLAFAAPPFNEAKAAELWGAQNKWAWYAQFCALHALYALIPLLTGGGAIYLWTFFTQNK
jgi:hypothetical protein